ncbi:MAG: serine/threonine protein kinase [Deltaproteobacteria bacterium]|nr:serine/threonine protein kinase [Deltaproteobacteria bacterium]
MEGVLGEGAFGTVYRGELVGTAGFRRKVALKVLKPSREGDEDLSKRLRDEARLLGQVSHRAVVHVDGLVILRNRWTVVMEYVEGVDLQRMLVRGPLPLGVALEIVSEIAAALHVAYWTRRENGQPLRLLHRDIKPSNIIVTATGEVKLVDFGVARAEFKGREAETERFMFGALGYMAPERMDGVSGPEGDVYGLGAVMYELLAGSPLGRTFVQIEKHDAHVGENLSRLGRERSEVSAELVALIHQMLDYHAEDRPTARDVEDRCRALRAEVGGGWLRDWAERSIPSFLHIHPADSSLQGQVLVEQEELDEAALQDEPIRSLDTAHTASTFSLEELDAESFADTLSEIRADRTPVPLASEARTVRLERPAPPRRTTSPVPIRRQHIAPKVPVWHRYRPLLITLAVLVGLPMLITLLLAVLWTV